MSHRIVLRVTPLENNLSDSCCVCKRHNRHLLAAALASKAADGWLLVPRKPTAQMLEAAAKAMSPGKRPTPNRVSVREKHAIRYRAMLAAAPLPPPPARQETKT